MKDTSINLWNTKIIKVIFSNCAIALTEASSAAQNETYIHPCSSPWCINLLRPSFFQSLSGY